MTPDPVVPEPPEGLLEAIQGVFRGSAGELPDWMFSRNGMSAEPARTILGLPAMQRLLVEASLGRQATEIVFEPATDTVSAPADGLVLERQGTLYAVGDSPSPHYRWYWNGHVWRDRRYMKRTEIFRFTSEEAHTWIRHLTASPVPRHEWLG